MSVNRVILVGNVGKNPEVRYLDGGTAVASITLATTEKGYTTKAGVVIPDRTEWHNLVAWRGLAEIAEKYIKKGSQLYVEGKIVTRKWEKDGVAQYRTEILADVIQMLGKKPEGGYNPEESTYSGGAPKPDNAATKDDFAHSDGSEGSDDLPF